MTNAEISDDGLLDHLKELGVDPSYNPARSALARERCSANAEAVVLDANLHIPTIDMSAQKDDIAEQLWNAARNVGFFTLVNHGIPQEDIDVVFAASKDFFGQTLEEKRKYPFDTVTNSGFEWKTQAPPSTNTIDQKESMQITARQGCMEGLWPKHPENFRDRTEGMMASAHELACTVLSLLEAKACPQLEPGTLANSHHLWNEDGQCTLRLIHYPPTDEEVLADTNLWRAGAHTDWGCVTLLFQRMGEEGLECRADPLGDSPKWIPVPPVEGGITVNVGDMLRLWSDERLTSNMHRVRMPKTPEECRRSRYSVAFFLQADKSALIESRKSSVSAGEYFAGRINSHFDKVSEDSE
ncbi:hypothetical protein ACHAXT_011290 [Thalassiosira profunda]